MAQRKPPDKFIWRMIEEADYAKLEAFNYTSDGNNNARSIMMPGDYTVDFDIPDHLVSATDFFDYYLLSFFDLIFGPTCDSLFKNGYRILRDIDELMHFWRSEMVLELNKPKHQAYDTFWPKLKKLSHISIMKLYRFKEIRSSIRSYDEDNFDGKPYMKG